MSHDRNTLGQLPFILMALFAMAGCDSAAPTAAPTPSSAPSPTASPTAESEWIDPNEIQEGPIVHEKLPDELVERIRRVHATFADVDGTPLEKWLEDFSRDINPAENVQIWEDMEVPYKKYLAEHEVDFETKKELFQVVLLRSMAPDQEVLARLELKKLTVDEAKSIMADYPSEPKPIEVIESP